jgi:HK97 family phage major capsid protein
MPKIETLEQLESYAAEVDAEREGFKASITAMEDANTKANELIEQLQTDNTQFKEKIKTLQNLIVSQHSIEMESTQEAKDYKLGKIVSIMVRNRTGGDGRGLPGDGKAMLDLGCIPAVSSKNLDAEIQVAKGFEDLYLKQYKSHLFKAGASTDPFTSDDSDSGGYLGSYIVPVDTQAEINRIAADASAMRGMVTVMPVRGLTTYLPTTTDAFTFTRVTSQVTAKTEDTLTLSRATLSVETYATWLAITEEADEDSLVSLGALVRQMMGEAWGTKYDELCLSDSSYGAMYTTGINEVVMGTGSSSFADVTTADLDNMIAALTTRSKRRGAKFYFHPTVWDYIANEKDADGNYKVRRVADEAPLRFRGYDVVLTDGMPSTADDAVSTPFVAFGNPSYIVNGEKVGFEFRVFDQTQSTMEYDQIFLRARTRHAFVLWASSAWVKLTTAAS